MRINIYCANMNKGIHYLEDIMKRFSEEEISKYYKSRFEARLELKDRTIYRVLPATDSSRGSKCEFAYIDLEITKDIVDTIIFPTILVKPGASHIEQFKYF